MNVRPKESTDGSECASSSSLYHAHVDYSMRLLTNISSLRNQSPSFCDVNILVENNVFPAHKAVLVSASPYFAAMFSLSMIERNSVEIPISGVTSTAFSELLEFMYTGKLKLCANTCVDLLIAADMLVLPDAVDICCIFLRSNISTTNAISIWTLALRYSCYSLAKFCEVWIKDHFCEFIEPFQFQNLSVQHLVTLISSEDIKITSEYQVLCVATNWFESNIDGRFIYLKEVFKHVRFNIIQKTSVAALLNKVKHSSLRDAIQQLANREPKGDNILEDDFCFPRRKARKFVLITGGLTKAQLGGLARTTDDDFQSLDLVEKFDTSTHEWTVLPSMHMPRFGHTLVNLSNKVYALGGESDSMIFDSVECYCPLSNSWAFLSPMCTPRVNHAAVVIGNAIFAMGGWIGAELGTSIECFDADRGIWQIVGTLLQPRHAFAAVTFASEIFIIGGLDDFGSELDLFESFHPVTRCWTSHPRMHTPRAYLSAVVCSDHLYVIGGSSEGLGALHSVERYSFENEQWELVAPMRLARSSLSAVEVDGKILVFGGKLVSSHSSKTTITSDSIESYDPVKNEWTMMERSPTSRCEAVAIVI